MPLFVICVTLVVVDIKGDEMKSKVDEAISMVLGEGSSLEDKLLQWAEYTLEPVDYDYDQLTDTEKKYLSPDDVSNLQTGVKPIPAETMRSLKSLLINYSLKDVESYEELTPEEKAIFSRDDFDHLISGGQLKF